ncbi:MAG: TIGR04282 family arsenosugar biosynthesis glycosyltransferase [Bacteroidetes bacterium]|nr:TIGR04282 family arsenosugar biosynthesis glycosyltransferase [Bacteroidota bacterium]
MEIVRMQDKALIVFARSPIAGRVKSRLTKLLTPEEAAGLYKAFLIDSLKQYSMLEVTVRLYMADDLPLTIPRFGTTVHQQFGHELGPRMQHAFMETAQEGFQRMVIIGTDHPTLPSSYIDRAFEALTQVHSVSIGPAEDGGYYLLGMNPFIDGLFDGITFGKSDVYAKTLVKAYETGSNVTELPWWYDIDRPSDLKRLSADEKDLPEHTLKIMRRLKVKYGI